MIDRLFRIFQLNNSNSSRTKLNSIEMINNTYNINLKCITNHNIIISVFNNVNIKSCKTGTIDNIKGLCYQFKYKDIKSAEYYFLIAIKKGNISSILNIAYLYFGCEKYVNALTYFMIYVNDRIKKNEDINDDILFRIGYIYEHLNSIDEAIKYYIKSAKKDNIYAMFNLAHIFMSVNDKNNFEKYFILAYKQNSKLTMKKFNKLNDNLYLYILLTNSGIQIDCDIILNDRNVIIYKNKLNALKKTDTCIICMEEAVCIPLECTHYLCINCYPIIIKQKKCHVCRMEL